VLPRPRDRLLDAGVDLFRREGYASTGVKRIAAQATRSGIDTRTARELAVFLVVGVEGAFVVSRATHSVQPVEVVRASLIAAVRAAQEQSHEPPGHGEARQGG
jgi:hypothetical protein